MGLGSWGDCFGLGFRGSRASGLFMPPYGLGFRGLGFRPCFTGIVNRQDRAKVWKIVAIRTGSSGEA